MKNVSVLIGSRDRPEALIRCLKSVFNQTLSPFEVIVYDDASEKAPLEPSIRNVFTSTQVKVIRSPVQRGVSGGRNILIQESKGDFLVFLDDDASFSNPQSLQNLIEPLTNNKVAIVAGKIFDYPPHLNGKSRLLIPFSQFTLKKNPQLADQHSLVSYFLGGVHAIRKSVLTQVGSYTGIFFYGEEELDLSYRVIQAGYEIHYTPKATIDHFPEVSSLQKKPELYYHVRNRIFLARKYIPLIALPTYLGSWLLRLFFRSFTEKRISSFLAGLYSGIKEFKSQPRNSLNPEAQAYLKYNHGRIWF